MSDEHTPILIVGGGLSGLSTALFLSWQGVRPLLVERHPDLLIHPRARGFNPRTIELFRQVGLERRIRAASFAGGERRAWVAVRAETLASQAYTPAEEAGDGDGLGDASPSASAQIDQDRLEVLLRARAVGLGADVRFSIELISLAHDQAGLSAVLQDRRTGAQRTVRADYLVAADGWASPTRQRLGVGVDGPGAFFHVLSAMIEADLRPALRGRRVDIAYLQRPSPGTILMARDQAGLRWVFGTGYTPERGESVKDYPEQRMIELVRAAAGLPDVPVRLHPHMPGTDVTVLEFPVGAHVAQRYQVGRVFFVGDAAHIVPSTGALGANTGIQDAHNLAWKLAMVVRGQAGPALLDSYAAERRPIGLFTMGQALARWQTRMGVGSAVNGPSLVDLPTLTFGYRYRSAAVLGAPEDGPPALPPRALAGQPGTRAPHVPLTLYGKKGSTIDLYGRRFVLLAGVGGASWIAAAERAARHLGVPIDAYRFVELGGWQAASAHRLGPRGALLVRPDGFVAWRAEVADGDPELALGEALARTLAREPAHHRTAAAVVQAG